MKRIVFTCFLLATLAACTRDYQPAISQVLCLALPWDDAEIREYYSGDGMEYERYLMLILQGEEITAELESQINKRRCDGSPPKACGCWTRCEMLYHFEVPEEQFKSGYFIAADFNAESGVLMLREVNW